MWRKKQPLAKKESNDTVNKGYTNRINMEKKADTQHIGDERSVHKMRD